MDVQGVHPFNLLINRMRSMLKQPAVRYPPAHQGATKKTVPGVVEHVQSSYQVPNWQ